MSSLRVLLVAANTERGRTPAPPLGLGLVAAAARTAGHDVRFLDLFTSPTPGTDLARAVAEHSPQVIGISIRNIDDQFMASPRFLLERAAEVATACREISTATLVVGGAGYSIFPRAALFRLGADYGIVGEGEVAFPALLDHLSRKEDPTGLPGVCSARGQETPPSFCPVDPRQIPSPIPETFADLDPSDPELWLPVQSRRGCPLDCTYCSTSSIEGRRIRLRPPSVVADEIARATGRGFRRFWIVDNTFNLPPSHAVSLCREISLRQLGIEWRCIVYPHRLTAELVGEMAAAGCGEASLGFESGSPPVLARLGKRFGPEDVRRVSDLLAEYHIRRDGFLLLGGPGETVDTVRESLDFADSLHLEGLQITVGIRIYPRTKLARIAVQEGIVSPNDDLLEPRFYVVPGLAPRINEMLAERAG